MRDESGRECQRALDDAMRFLTPRPRTADEVRRRLLRRGIAADVVQRTVTELERRGLVDDAALARGWIEWRIRSRPAGAARIARELRARGVAAELVDQVLAGFTDKLDSIEVAAALLRRQRWRYAALDPVAAQRRMLGFMARRGYPLETAYAVIDQVWKEWQRDEG